jgi:3-hydroxyacyl-CoA dehydrogenase/enoyl-CoA hydratase/3-hydroxybutyryl-CoA epimerase/enoyl-CoA isomerase
MSLLLGLGFPRHVGGALKYADWLGLNHVVARCDVYASLGALYRVPEWMRAAALAGKSLY